MDVMQSLQKKNQDAAAKKRNMRLKKGHLMSVMYVHVNAPRYKDLQYMFDIFTFQYGFCWK